MAAQNPVECCENVSLSDPVPSTTKEIEENSNFRDLDEEEQIKYANEWLESLEKNTLSSSWLPFPFLWEGSSQLSTSDPAEPSLDLIPDAVNKSHYGEADLMIYKGVLRDCLKALDRDFLEVYENMRRMRSHGLDMLEERCSIKKQVLLKMSNDYYFLSRMLDDSEPEHQTNWNHEVEHVNEETSDPESPILRHCQRTILYKSDQFGTKQLICESDFSVSSSSCVDYLEVVQGDDEYVYELVDEDRYEEVNEENDEDGYEADDEDGYEADDEDGYEAADEDGYEADDEDNNEEDQSEDLIELFNSLSILEKSLMKVHHHMQPLKNCGFSVLEINKGRSIFEQICIKMSCDYDLISRMLGERDLKQVERNHHEEEQVNKEVPEPNTLEDGDEEGMYGFHGLVVSALSMCRIF